MIRRAADSFWFPEKLGLRLAELRLQQGLTQGQVAELMGRAGKGSKTIVCRLERGRFLSPSLRLLGDYLRACGAGFENVMGVLDAYTALPAVVEVETRRALDLSAQEQAGRYAVSSVSICG